MAAAKKSTAKKAAAKKSTKKATKKATTRKATAKKATKKGTARKATKKATKKTTASANVQLVVSSRIKEAARAADVRVSGDFAEALNAEVNEVLGRAIARAKSNNRSTLRPGDL
jgi:methionine aminopeptidase